MVKTAAAKQRKAEYHRGLVRTLRQREGFLKNLRHGALSFKAEVEIERDSMLANGYRSTLDPRAVAWSNRY